MKDGDSVTEHLNAFNTVVSQLLSVDIKISNEDKCISLLCSLPDSWDSLVIAIGSNATALQFDEIVSALLTEEVRRKNMDSQNGDASVRGRSQNINKNKSSSGRSKSRGRSKSPGKPVKVVRWKCGKEWHFRRDCKSKATDKGKGSDGAPFAEAKTTSDEGGDVYLASSSTHVDHEAWLIDSGASFHFTPHREWFCEYEKYDGGDAFLGDDRKARIIGRGKVKLKLQGGRVRTLSGVLHIPALARNLIYQNGVAERMNKTLMERARSMPSGVGLGQEFWAETVDTTCYLVNGSPSSALEDKTPQEVWTGKKPSLSHLRVFGCDAYVHVPKENRTKLDSKSEKCIFIGYKDGLKGYKLWNPVTRKVVYSRDVVFREVKDVIKHEVQPKEPVKIEFELKEEESDSVAEEESEDEEPQTPANCEGSNGFRGWKTLERGHG
eukprot:PITA_26886